MTDVGVFPPKAAGVRAAERERLLRQIASALALPVAAFGHKPAPDEVDGPSSAECSTMLAAFCKIRDPQVRAFCLQVFEAFAQR